MDKVPVFCENLRFRRLIWEELHSTVTHKRIKHSRVARLSSMVVEPDMTPTRMKEDDRLEAIKENPKSPISFSAGKGDAIKDIDSEFETLAKTVNYQNMPREERHSVMEVEKKMSKNLSDTTGI